MSLFAAEMLLLAVAGLLSLVPPFSTHRFMRGVGVVASTLGAAAAGLGLLMEISDTGLRGDAGMIPMSIVTLATLVLLFNGQLLAQGVDDWIRDIVFNVPRGHRLTRRQELLFWSGSAGLAALVFAGSLLYLHVQRTNINRLAEARMSAVVEHQAAQVARWHQERSMAAQDLTAALRGTDIASIIGPGEPATIHRLYDRLKDLDRRGVYGTIVPLTRDGIAILQPGMVGVETPPPATVKRLIENCSSQFLPGKQSAIAWHDRKGRVRMGIVVPLCNSVSDEPLAYLLLQTDPRSALLPFLRDWPTGEQAQAASVALWWMDGAVLRLVGVNDPNASRTDRLSSMRSTADVDLLSAQVSLGEKGMVEALDQDGFPSLGMGRVVKHTPWLITCTVASEEMQTALRREALQLGALLVGIIGFAAYALRATDRRRQLQFERQRLRADLDRAHMAERLGLVLRYANDIVFMVDEDGRITEANERMSTAFGCPVEAIRGMLAEDLRPPHLRLAARENIKASFASNGRIYEDLVQRRDGSIFPIEISSRPVAVGGQRQLLAVARDITERRERAAQIAKLERLHHILIRLGEAEVRDRTRRDLTNSACEVLVNGGLRLAWIGWHNPAAQKVEVSAVAGDHLDFVKTLDIRPMHPVMGRGPAGSAFREGSTVICNDFLNAPTTTPWHDAARASGLHASIGLPLIEEGKVVGVLCVYASEAGYFGTPEVELLERAAGNLSFALEALSREERRKAADLALQKLSRVVEQAPMSIVITDLMGRIEYVNPHFTTATGYMPLEVLGKNPRMFQSGETPPGAYAEMWNTLRRGDTWRGELLNQRKDGSRYSEMAVIAPVLDECGRPTFYVAMKEDITESKRVAVALRESRRKLHEAERDTLRKFNTDLEAQVVLRTAELASRNREVQALLQSIPDMVMRVRADGVVLHCQKAHGDSGLANLDSCADSAGANSMVATQLIPHVMAAGRQTLDGGTSVVLEAEMTTPNGIIEVELRTAPVEPNEFVVFIRDITARRQLEVNMARALEKEREASAMKSRFISVTSHEFRTPMAAALGSVELLTNHMDRLTPEKRTSVVRRIRDSLMNMEGLIQEIMTLSRAESGRLRVDIAETDIEALVSEVVEEIRAASKTEHRFEIVGRTGSVMSDRNLLRHLVTNLISNAVRYSPAGSLVQVRLARGESSYRLDVQDRGIGVPVADRERVFEPFERGANVGTIRGTGLGLNIVKRMTELLGGTISLDSVESEGSTFTVVFPQPVPPPASVTTPPMPFGVA